LLNIPRSHPDAKVLRPQAKVVHRMLDMADHVWVSTAGLLKRLSEIRLEATVIENGLDERIWTKPGTSFANQPVRILCMGTTTHDEDFKLVEPALLRLKSEYADRVVIDIVGMTQRNELPAGLNRVGPSISGARSYPGFVHWLSTFQPGWHIGVAPLLDTQFNRAKSPIKAMDYAAMGLVVLASDTPVYRGSIADGPAGLLVPNNEAAWYAALDALLRDRDRRLEIAGRARAAFLAQASLLSQAELRRTALMRLLHVKRTNAA
jgi:glycosyltransferase involved in cell wall biosynthesis